MEVQAVPAAAAPQKVDFITKIVQNEKGNPLFREASTILEAIHETLQNELKIGPDMPGYPTALFGALLRALQVAVNKETYDHMAAYILLFQHALQKVSPQIRQRACTDIEKCLHNILENLPKSKIEQKYIITIYYSLLQVKPPAEWKKDTTKEMFNYILDLIDTEKMAVRKKASKCLGLLVEHGLFKIPEMDFFLQQHFLEYIKSSKINPQRTIYALYFLNQSLKFFPIRVASELSFQLVNVLKSEDINFELATHIYSTVENLLAAKPLNGGLVEGFLKDLLTHPPDLVESSNVNFSYLQCLSQTILHLNTVDPTTAKNYISSSISACTEYLVSGNSKLASLACKSIELIISHTINKSLWVFGAVNNEESLESFLGLETLDIDTAENKGPTPFHRIISALRYLVSSQFEHVQKYVSSILTTFYDYLDNSCPEPAYELISHWIENRGEKAPNVWQPVVGKFIQKVNLEFILKAYPLNILQVDLASPNFENESSSWLLPVLRKYLRIDSIKLFLDYFLPIVAKLDDYIYSKPSEEFTEVEKTYEILYVQIWEIFPRFCKFTKENVSFIDQIYEITTRVIASRQTVRKYVCQGLEILTSYFLKLPKYSNPQMIKAQESLTACSNKLMPKLCALYMKEAFGYKVIIKLIRTMSSLCSKDYLETVFLKHIKKLVQEKLNNKPYTVTHMKECDILVALATSMDLAAHYDIAKQFIRSFLSDKSGFQKRAFRLLQLLATKVHASFLSELLEILEDAKLIQSASKLGKLNCTLTILEKLEYSPEKMEEIMQLVQNLLPEILLSLKETNKKTRAVAVNTIKFLTRKFQEFEAGAMFASLVTAGLAAKTSLMKSTAILGLAQVIREAQTGFEENFIWETTSIVLLMVKEKNREIYKAVLQYLKVYIKVVPKQEVIKNLQNILIPVFEWDEDGREDSKLLLRHIIEKLVRKLGKSTVEEAMPGEHKKLVKYITKQEKISKKKKEHKRNERKMYAEGLMEEKKQKARKAMDEEEDAEFDQMPTRMDTFTGEMDMDTNNLLLKFDTMKEKFHFVEHPIARIKDKQKKEAELVERDRDVFFNEQTGKIHISDENEVTGKKRKGDTRFDEDMFMEEEKKPEQPRTIRKVVRVANDKIVNKQVNPAEEQKTQTHLADAPQRRKSVINRNIIADVKIFNSETLNPTAYIPINPKILNKRNRSNAAKAFDFLVSRKKTGSLAGLKSKMKS